MWCRLQVSGVSALRSHGMFGILWVQQLPFRSSLLSLELNFWCKLTIDSRYPSLLVF